MINQKHPMQVPLNALYGSEDGECYDDVNAAVWQMYFNVAMKVPQRPNPPAPARATSQSTQREQGIIDGRVLMYQHESGVILSWQHFACCLPLHFCGQPAVQVRHFTTLT